MSGKDYLANLKLEPGDKLDFGVRGMRWGIRKGTSSSGSSSSGSSTSTSKPTGPEHPAERYTRLLAQAKQKGANSLNEEELRFVTQRGDAITKVNRLNERKPGWLSEAAKQALTGAAKKRLNSIADGVSKKYIDDVLLNTVTK